METDGFAQPARDGDPNEAEQYKGTFPTFDNGDRRALASLNHEFMMTEHT